MGVLISVCASAICPALQAAPEVLESLFTLSNKFDNSDCQPLCTAIVVIPIAVFGLCAIFACIIATNQGIQALKNIFGCCCSCKPRQPPPYQIAPNGGYYYGQPPIQQQPSKYVQSKSRFGGISRVAFAGAVNSLLAPQNAQQQQQYQQVGYYGPPNGPVGYVPGMAYSPNAYGQQYPPYPPPQYPPYPQPPQQQQHLPVPVHQLQRHSSPPITHEKELQHHVVNMSTQHQDTNHPQSNHQEQQKNQKPKSSSSNSKPNDPPQQQTTKQKIADAAVAVFNGVGVTLQGLAAAASTVSF